MFGSVESLSMVSLPDLSLPEETSVISLDCWQDICLSKIWIPDHLLTSRKKSSNTWAARGLFHTLKKRDHAKQIESFSVYSDSDNENEDVFLSDSDNDFNPDSIESDKILENSPEFIDESEKVSKITNVETNISLHEILKSNTEVDMSSFDFIENCKHRTKKVETLQSNKKNKKDKKKKKIAKSVPLDSFLEGYTEEDKQEAYAKDYYKKITKTNYEDSEVQLKNNYEFPDLKSKEIEFVHKEKLMTEKSDISMKTVAEILNQSNKSKNENISTNFIETIAPELETTVRKIVIENIPSEACHEDIFTLLCGYGEVKDFTLQPDGDFFKAFIEIDLIGDIDWIVECLNGTEPFGASSRVLKCYKHNI